MAMRSPPGLLLRSAFNSTNSTRATGYGELTTGWRYSHVRSPPLAEAATPPEVVAQFEIAGPVLNGEGSLTGSRPPGLTTCAHLVALKAAPPPAAQAANASYAKLTLLGPLRPLAGRKSRKRLLCKVDTFGAAPPPRRPNKPQTLVMQS